MKIEMVLPSLTAAGMEVMVARMAKKLALRGHQVSVCCITEPGNLAEDVRTGGVHVTDPGARGLINPRWLFRLVRHLRTSKPDVVHIHSGAWFKGALAARLAGVPRIVYTAHGYLAEEARAEAVLNRFAVVMTDCVVSVSKDLTHLLKRRRLAGRHLAVVTNGIDVDAFSPRIGTNEIRERFGLAPATLLIGTVARLEPIKNQAMLIEGVARARAEGVDCAVVLIGAGTLRGELEALADRLGVRPYVHFWGLERDVARLYPELDVFALTSDSEGTSISLLEAMACGVCPVATDVGGNPEVVGKEGILVPVRQASALANAFAALAQDPARRRALGRSARQRVVEHFSDERMLDEYELIYRARP